MHYIPPSIDDLKQLKTDLDYNGDQMAELFALAGSHQWRKYTGGTKPREVSFHMLFYAAARLALPKSDIDKVIAQMHAIGADVAP